MTATRLTRSGRSRFLVGFGILILTFGFIAIFHSSQTQLDESRQQRLHCEQQQEALNARMQAIIEHKFRLEQSLETERQEHLETRQNLEQKAKEQSDQFSKAKLEANMHYDSLQQRYKLLQKEHVDLVGDCSRTKKSQLEMVNSLESKVKSLQSQLQQARSLNDKDLDELKTKYETLVQENDRLEVLLKTTALNSENNKKKVNDLMETLNEYKSNCDYKPKTDHDTIYERPLAAPQVGTIGNQQLPNHPLDKPLVQRSFNEQKLVSPDLYKVSIKLTNNTVTTRASVSNLSTQKTSFASKLENSNGAGANAQLRPFSYKHENVIINSVENFQIIPKPLVSDDDKNRVAESVQQMSPLNVTAKISTAANAVLVKGAGDADGHDMNRHALSLANQASTPTLNKSKRSSTAKEVISLPHKPPKQIPLGVAPIPANFEDLLGNNQNDEQDGGKMNKHQAEGEEKQDTDNNRYANVVDELIGKNNAGEQENGAHEVKDPDFNADKNDDNLNNNGAEEDNNFFEAKVGPKDNDDHADGEDIEMFGMAGHKHNHKDGDDELGGAANALLDGDNLNNEVVGDQGKEQFGDGLHLDEGIEEEEDEDDYSNPVARQQEGPAIRN